MKGSTPHLQTRRYGNRGVASCQQRQAEQLTVALVIFMIFGHIFNVVMCDYQWKSSKTSRLCGDSWDGAAGPSYIIFSINSRVVNLTFDCSVTASSWQRDEKQSELDSSALKSQPGSWIWRDGDVLWQGRCVLWVWNTTPSVGLGRLVYREPVHVGSHLKKEAH